MKHCTLLLLFFCFLFSDNAYGQHREFVFKNFTQEEGLPSNETYYVFEDSRHYLWIATDLGVVRYNGNKFELFNLPDNVVFKIKEDSKGRIWFFNQKAKLAYFENEQIKIFPHNDSITRHVKNIQVTDAYIDQDDNIFLNSPFDSNFVVSKNGQVKVINYGSFPDESNKANYDTGAYKIEETGPGKYFVQKTRYNWLYSKTLNIFLKTKAGGNTLYSIPYTEESSHHYGCISLNGRDLYFYSGKTIFLLKQDGTSISKQMPEPVLCLNEMDGKIWAGMYKSGAFLLNPDLTFDTENAILPNKSVSCITTDFEGGIWFSTLENGLYYIRNTNIVHFKINDVSNQQVFRVFNKENKFLLFGNTKGLHKLKAGLVTPVMNEDNLNISDIFAGPKGDLFISGDIYLKAGRGEIRMVNDPDLKKVNILCTPYEIAKLNDTLVINRIFHIGAFNASSKNLRNNTVYAAALNESTLKTIPSTPCKLFADKSGTVWAAANNGLFKINSSFDALIPFKKSASILNQGVTCIRQMDNDLLVAGIRFSGIAVLKDTTVMAVITEQEGLLSNKIKYLLPLKNQLWVATARGISVISFTSYQPLKYSIVNIGKNEGFYNVTINHLAEYQGQIVAATSNGMYFIENPDTFLNKQFKLLPFFINTVSYYKGDTSGINSITLPYSKNRLIIKYNAVSFNSYEEIKYLYRFEKADTSWHSTVNPELLMENLQPGIYKLQIKAEIPNQNRASSIQEFTIEVQKPWWQNNWFRLLVMLAVSATIYLFVKARITKIKTAEKRKTELNSKIAELEQTALRSQMNPHFIFNCLTSIQQLIVSGNKVDANEYLVKFARLIRKTLELSASPFITVREEMEYLGEYLFLEQLRLSGQFEFKINTGTDVDKDKVQIPNMMIQPVVENCIRHGIKPLENKLGLIEVLFEQMENHITCTVTDNGIGRTSSNTFNNNSFTEHKSYGVDIIRKRLKAFTDFTQQDIGIEIKDLYKADGTASGTQVIIQLPYKKI